MVKKALVTTIILALASFAVSGAESGSSKGDYANHTVSSDTVELSGGGSVQVNHFRQFTFADDPSHPIDNSSQDCVGVTRFDADGNVVSASGSCFGSKGGTDSASWWWRQEEAGTESCPIQCGTWGYFDGGGKYKGISGNGTWVNTAIFANGNTGTWKGSYSVP